MRVFCEYDHGLDCFLKSIVSYVLDLFDGTLVLDDLEEIELVKRIEGVPIESDGRITNGGKKITLTARLYDKLPIYDIPQLKNNEDFQTIVCTIYHEMGHISDQKTMPSIYAAAQDFSDKKRMLAAFFWAEYLAEKRSSETSLVSHQEYCNDFVKRKWESFKYDFDNPTEDNFFYLCKALSYFMGRTTRIGVRKNFCNKIINPLLKEFIEVLSEEIDALDQKLPFDDVALLSNLSGIMAEYYSKFNQKFTHS